jgi:ABC-type bacteriocin transporter
LQNGINIKQRDITDCGAACLASVAAYHKLQISVSRVRQLAGTDAKGTNVLGMTDAAEKLGFLAKGAKGKISSLGKIPLPAIAHMVIQNGLNHYVVIYRVSKKHIVVMDPGDGQKHKKSIDQFNKEWTGIIILLVPGERFIKETLTSSTRMRFWLLIKPHCSMIIQALIGAIVFTILGLSTSIYLQKILDFVLIEGDIQLLNLLSVIMIAILIFQIFIGSFKTMLGLRTGQLIDARLILGYYKHLLQLPQRFFDTMRVGEIISRVNDAVKIRLFINDTALSILVNVLILFFSISLMFLYYWKLAVIMLAIIPVYLLIFFINNLINKKWSRILMERSADLETQLVESLNASGTIRRFGLEDYANERTEIRFISLLKSIYKSSIYSLYVATSSDFITRMFTIILLWAGSYFVIKRELSPGELFSFYALIGYFTGPALAVIASNKSMQDALIAADRLFEIIDLETESTDEQKIELTKELLGNIEFSNVTFRYGTRVTVFNKLNLVILRDKSTAIIGESGSGKSTLLSLIQNLYPVNEGSITIAGTDIRYINNQSLRRIIAVVLQQIDLFQGTVLENIGLGYAEPDMKRVYDVSNLLGIHEFIEKLPDGYNTILSEQGNNLSGGQRQRLAIARALYRDPEILVLDEATSSLDTISEQCVQNALLWFKNQGKTVIIITHRLSTIKSCDHVIVLKNGQVVEQGRYANLINSNGQFKKMWDYPD